MRALVPIAAAQAAGLQVEQLASVGEPLDTIAQSLGMTVAALRSEYANALDLGPARRRAEIIGLMFAAARDGSVPALMWLMKRTGAVLAERPPREARPAPMGKKAQALATAEKLANAGGRFAPPRPPRLAIVKS